nr:Os11g0153450 [Ipomoea batatas]
MLSSSSSSSSGISSSDWIICSFKRPSFLHACMNSCVGILISLRMNRPSPRYDLNSTHGFPLRPMQEIGGGKAALIIFDLFHSLHRFSAYKCRRQTTAAALSSIPKSLIISSASSGSTTSELLLIIISSPPQVSLLNISISASINSPKISAKDDFWRGLMAAMGFHDGERGPRNVGISGNGLSRMFWGFSQAAIDCPSRSAALLNLINVVGLSLPTLWSVCSKFMTPASLALVVVWTLNPLVSDSSVEWQGCSSLARISCGGLWWPFSPDGSRLGVGYSSARKSSLSRNVFSISLFKKFITWTTYISAVNGGSCGNLRLKLHRQTQEAIESIEGGIGFNKELYTSWIQELARLDSGDV